MSLILNMSVERESSKLPRIAVGLRSCIQMATHLFTHTHTLIQEHTHTHTFAHIHSLIQECQIKKLFQIALETDRNYNGLHFTLLKFTEDKISETSSIKLYIFNKQTALLNYKLFCFSNVQLIKAL